MKASSFLMRVTQNGNNALLYSRQAEDGAAEKYLSNKSYSGE